MNNNNVILSLIILVVAMGLCVSSYAEKNVNKPVEKMTSDVKRNVGADRVKPKVNLRLVTGTVTSIDNSDPKNIKLSIKNEANDDIQTIFVDSKTNFAKITDISELKPGGQVQIIAHKTEDKETANEVVFGNIKIPAVSKKTQNDIPKTSVSDINTNK